MRNRLVAGAFAIFAVLLLAGGGAYVYFFSGLRSAPAALTLRTPSPSASAVTSGAPVASPAAGGSAGTWAVGAGSLAGYRVSEQFVGQTSSHEAVARTSAVSGQLTVSQAGSVSRLETATITVQLGGLQSTDTVAGYNVSNRDRIVSSSLGVSQYPAATFTASPLALPAGFDSGPAVTISLPGKLTIHGVTRDASAAVHLQVSGATAQAVGSIAAQMTDFGIRPPSLGFTTVQPAVTIEFELNLSRG